MPTERTAEELLLDDPFRKDSPWTMKYVNVLPPSRPDVFNVVDWISKDSEVTFEGIGGGNPSTVHFGKNGISLALNAIGGGIATTLYAQSVIRKDGINYVTSWRFVARMVVDEQRIEVSIRARTMPGGSASPDGDGLTNPKT